MVLAGREIFPFADVYCRQPKRRILNADSVHQHIQPLGVWEGGWGRAGDGWIPGMDMLQVLCPSSLFQLPRMRMIGDGVEG